MWVFAIFFWAKAETLMFHTDVLTCWRQVKTFTLKFSLIYLYDPLLVEKLILPLSSAFQTQKATQLSSTLTEAHIVSSLKHATAMVWRNMHVTHKRMILQLMSGLKGKGEGKACCPSKLSLWSSGVFSPSSPSCCCHVGRDWTSTNWERAPRGSIPFCRYRQTLDLRERHTASTGERERETHVTNQIMSYLFTCSYYHLSERSHVNLDWSQAANFLWTLHVITLWAD